MTLPELGPPLALTLSRESLLGALPAVVFSLLFCWLLFRAIRGLLRPPFEQPVAEQQQTAPLPPLPEASLPRKFAAFVAAAFVWLLLVASWAFAQSMLKFEPALLGAAPATAYYLILTTISGLAAKWTYRKITRPRTVI